MKNIKHTSFAEISEKVVEVYGSAGVTALLFSTASLFRDIVVKELGFFPLLHLYGPSATGKSRLAYLCQKLVCVDVGPNCYVTGDLNIHSILKRYSKQFNGIVCFEEYYDGNYILDAFLKEVYEKDTYQTSNEDGEVFPAQIKCNTIVTGNYKTSDASLSSRMIIETMTKNVFSKTEVNSFHELNQLIENDLNEIALQHVDSKRHMVEHVFNYERLKAVEKELEGMLTTTVHYRLLKSVSILVLFQKILGNCIGLSDEYVKQHFVELLKEQEAYLVNCN